MNNSNPSEIYLGDQFATSTATSKTRVQILNLNPNEHTENLRSKLDTLSERTDLEEGITPDVHRYIYDGSIKLPVAVVATEGGLADPQNEQILTAVLNYVLGGGILIFTFTFPTMIEPRDMDKFSTKRLRLPWTRGSHRRNDFVANEIIAVLPRGCKWSFDFPIKINTPVFTTKGALEEQIRYVIRCSIYQSTHESQVAVVGAHYGYVAYIGLNNLDVETISKIILGLLHGVIQSGEWFGGFRPCVSATGRSVFKFHYLSGSVYTKRILCLNL